MSIINPHSVYELTRPGRIDPKFIGIGEVYTQHKHKRKQLEKIYHDTKNSLLFTEKTYLELSKSLQDKQKEYERLETVKNRHLKDIQRKMKQDQQKKIKIQELRRRTTFQRRKLKSSIQQRMIQLKQQRRREKNNIKQKSKDLRDQLNSSEYQKYSMRKTMYNTINSDKKKGNSMVDQFYRQRILESLDDYKKRIKMEDQKSNFYQKNVQKMNMAINAISSDNQKKVKRLQKLEEKIEKLNPLKTFFSTKLSSNLNETTYSRKSSQKSVSSKKPSEILLEGKLKSGNVFSNRSKIGIKKKNKLIGEENPEYCELIVS